LNQEAIIEIDALPDITFKGIVTAIYPLPIEEGGVVLYNAKINLDVPENSAAKIGMSTEADIIIDKRSNVLLVPERAIQKDSEGNPVVKVMVNEQIQERPVDIGISDGYQTEIVSGLNEGETVVVER
jgi:HlyD family secretion protein